MERGRLKWRVKEHLTTRKRRRGITRERRRGDGKDGLTAPCKIEIGMRGRD